MRAPVLVALILLGGAAPARAAVRLHWRGLITVGARAPARLDQAVRAHLAVALRQLGMQAVATPPADAEGGARCELFPGAKRLARCRVEVVHSQGGERAERQVDIPYRDADDLAESISLLVADMLGSDLHDILTPSPGSIEPEDEPEPTPAPEPASTPRSESRSPSRKPPSPVIAPPEREPVAPTPPMQAREPEPRPRAPSTNKVIAAAPSRPGELRLEAGPTVAFGFDGEPPLGGALLRALYVGPVALRLGGALSVSGGATSAQGYRLSFTRLVTGPLAGAGFSRGRVRGALTFGPALYLLAISAAPGGAHNLLAFALVAGARLSVGLAGPLDLYAGADLTGSLTEERVVAGPALVAGFGRFSLETTVGLAYRR